MVLMAIDRLKAIWTNGYIIDRDNKSQKWIRKNQNIIVEMKRLNNPNDITVEFMKNKISKGYGVTQDPETKNYMMVLDYKCKKCNFVCYAKHFQQSFNNWTNGNDDINKFIQNTQLSSHDNIRKAALEWIPYNKFYDIEYIARGGFDKVYKAKWIDGNINCWDDDNQNWKRICQDMYVALKSLNDSKDITLKFIDGIASHNKIDNNYIIKFYGITQDPHTKNYIMVLKYAESGSLRNYFDINHNKLDVDIRINYLFNIACGLESIHKNELIHRDLHIGNILKNNYDIYIADMGLCKLVNYNQSNNTKNNIYGVLPYIAPELKF
ncbi:hypothetical protein RclHR1_13740009 [Rhizophagus clarus]|uniref:Protein kinase domain-containing protein n=1 Tax=Rhizophagus clarus TaxID=94130 RepID=A0A2Z6QQR3_9GLOM|nr:hypothetical protein RclHR1_13740009 [Rhizophagus clarus]